MAKLVKNDPKGDVTSILSVAEMLRKKGSTPLDETNETPQKDEGKQTPIEQKTTHHIVKGTDLENMLLEVKQNREQGIVRRPIMVDSPLYDVFAMLKAKKRVPAAGLVSMICRQWIIQNSAELELMLGQKINVQ